MAPTHLQICGTKFRDEHNREVTIHGINVAADAKFPSSPDLPSHVSTHFFDGDNVSFVGRPFPVEEADLHFSRLKRWGYNTIRYIFTWEAIEAAGPGKYDEDWISHTITILRIAKSYSFYIFMDPHQDVWSRFSGGSGAPMWTFYACGLNPRAFAATEAALVHCAHPQPENYPAMIWATNYTRMACQVLFTLFFGGKDFAPKAIINGQNIQDFLQDHFISSCKYLAQRIHDEGDLENTVVIGWESLNEPNRGLIGYEDIALKPASQRMQKGTSPSAWQAILTGSGRACEVETWDFGVMGPYKTGTTLIDPKDQSAWLPSDFDDSHYGWTRDSNWKLGVCIWAQHGVWDPSSDSLLKADYFMRDPQTGTAISYEYFTNHWFMMFYRKYREAIRGIHSDSILLCQPPVLEIPPSIADTNDDDANMVFAPHFYDGLTLLNKKWNRLWNVDVFGVMRNKYLSPLFAVRIGESNIRNCLRDQLNAIRQEGVQYMGEHPCIFTEIGIPFDMDNKYAYQTGDYSSQISAMDANHYALEGSKASGFTLWTYATKNNHKWGDQWNGEDLSIISNDTPKLLSFSNSQENMSASTISTNSISSKQPKSFLSTSGLSKTSIEEQSSNAAQASSYKQETLLTDSQKKPGFRAAEAFVRPYPLYTDGDLVEFDFDLKQCVFSLKLTSDNSSRQDAPTEIFLPDYHFPPDLMEVEISDGKWNLRTNASQSGPYYVLEWWHAEGEQNIKVAGFLRQESLATSTFDICRQSGCSVM